MARISIVNRYFWPETVLANDIAAWLVEAGHEVDVITGPPDYNPEASHGRSPAREEWRGVRVRRVRLLPERGRGLARQVNGLLFIAIASLMILVGRRRDLVWTTSIPPVLQPLLLRIATAIRGERLLYFVQDIYPEIALLMGMVKPGPFTRLVARADRVVLNGADLVVTLSADMATTLEARSRPRRLALINNFSAVEAAAPPAQRTEGPCRFVFAGNIGRFQNLEALVELFGGLDPGEARLVFLGEGRVKARLIEMVAARGLATVEFHDYLPAAAAHAFVGACDIGVVSLVPGLYRLAYPSKTFTYLAAGRPVLCCIEPESELARDLEARSAGLALDWSAPRDQQLATIRRLIATQRQMADALLTRTADLYDREAARGRWLEAVGIVLG